MAVMKNHILTVGQSLYFPATLLRNISLCLKSQFLNAENIQNFYACLPITTEPKSKTSPEISSTQLSLRWIHTGTLFLLCCGSPSSRVPTCPTLSCSCTLAAYGDLGEDSGRTTFKKITQRYGLIGPLPHKSCIALGLLKIVIDLVQFSQSNNFSVSRDFYCCTSAKQKATLQVLCI